MSSGDSARSRFTFSWVWTLTILWFAGSLTAIWVWSLPYDQDASLTISEFGDIGSLVAAIVAPVAVFWIIKSFYVQKAELSAAVKAAADQAKAANAQAQSLSQQMALLEAQHRSSQLSAFNVIHRKQVAAQTSSFTEEKHIFRVNNIGQATASVARLYMSGKKANGGYWLDDSGVAIGIKRDEVHEFEWLVKMGPAESTTSLLIEIRYRSAGGKDLADYFAIWSHAYERDAVARPLTREVYEEMMLQAGMAIPGAP